MEKRGRGRPRISRSDQISEFFQVYIPDRSSKQLQIPPDFIKNFNGRLPKKVTLKNLGGKSWDLDIENDKDGMFLKNGWSEFVKDSCLVLGEFLVFRYNGCSGFTVRIFGKNGCKKEDDLTHNRTSLGKRERPTGCGENSTRKMKTRSSFSEFDVKIKEEDEEDLEEVNEFMSNSKYPSFKVVMRPYFLEKGYVDMPAAFANMYITEDATVVKLEVSNKSWQVKPSRVRRGRLCGGWGTFLAENPLGEGDICVFELIDNENLVFKVTVFKHIN